MTKNGNRNSNAARIYLKRVNARGKMKIEIMAHAWQSQMQSTALDFPHHVNVFAVYSSVFFPFVQCTKHLVDVFSFSISQLKYRAYLSRTNKAIYYDVPERAGVCVYSASTTLAYSLLVSVRVDFF